MNTENLSAFMRKEEEKLINRTKKKHLRLAIRNQAFPSLQYQPIKTRRLTSHRKKKKVRQSIHDAAKLDMIPAGVSWSRRVASECKTVKN